MGFGIRLPTRLGRLKRNARICAPLRHSLAGREPKRRTRSCACGANNISSDQVEDVLTSVPCSHSICLRPHIPELTRQPDFDMQSYWQLAPREIVGGPGVHFYGSVGAELSKYPKIAEDHLPPRLRCPKCEAVGRCMLHIVQGKRGRETIAIARRSNPNHPTLAEYRVSFCFGK